tara:strand:- start:75 stop:452 length:378 start_codon:yes stop_codon:yes gene_type:complete
MKKIILLMLMLSPFANAETKYFVCVDAITKEPPFPYNGVLQINIDEEWIQFDEYRLEEVFINDNFRQEIGATDFATDGNGNRATRWEFTFNKITGAFKFVQIDLPTFTDDGVFYFICTPTEPVLQ